MMKDIDAKKFIPFIIILMLFSPIMPENLSSIEQREGWSPGSILMCETSDTHLKIVLFNREEQSNSQFLLSMKENTASFVGTSYLYTPVSISNFNLIHADARLSIMSANPLCFHGSKYK